MTIKTRLAAVYVGVALAVATGSVWACDFAGEYDWGNIRTDTGALTNASFVEFLAFLDNVFATASTNQPPPHATLAPPVEQMILAAPDKYRVQWSRTLVRVGCIIKMQAHIYGFRPDISSSGVVFVVREDDPSEVEIATDGKEANPAFDLFATYDSITESQPVPEITKVEVCTVPAEAPSILSQYGCNTNSLTAWRTDDGYVQVFPMPNLSGVTDAFQYSVEIDQSKGVCWVYKTGGIAGVHEKYGPIKLKDWNSNKALEGTSQ